MSYGRVRSRRTSRFRFDVGRCLLLAVVMGLLGRGRALAQDPFVVQTSDGDYRLVVGLLAQVDGRFSLDDPSPIINTFAIRTVRPIFSGTVAKYFDYKIMPDFGNGTTLLQEAYVDIRFSPKFRLRSGKDKVPVGYEWLQEDAHALFPERALASSLVPTRDVGVQVQGDLSPHVFYAAGLFNGTPDGATTTTDVDTNNAKDLSGRMVAQLLGSTSDPGGRSTKLGFQVGGSRGTQIGVLPSFKTSVGQTYFSYATGIIGNGVRTRVSPAVFYYYKAFGAFGEYTRSSQPVARASVKTDVTNSAWEVTGSIVLTGEATSDRGVRPKNNFDPANGTWGALQLAARYGELMVDPAVFTAGLATVGSSRSTKSFTIAANWYPNPHVTYYATFERTVFKSDFPVRARENAILFRTQVAF